MSFHRHLHCGDYFIRQAIALAMPVHFFIGIKNNEENLMRVITPYTSPIFSHDTGPYTIKHGFFGRKGGLSKGLYQGLNVGLGSNDDPSTIIQNRKLASDHIIADATLHSVHQIHSASVVIAGDKTCSANRPQADALVTNKPNILLGILTADCVPILFADHETGIIGAAHAGWKGAITGVTDNVIKQMVSLGAARENILCAIGPCIAQKSYEVDNGFYNVFIQDNPDSDHFFKVGKMDHYQFDIEAYVASRLAKAGIKNIHCLSQDTYSQEGEFYSYRRSCHKGEDGYGRQISIIAMQE